MVSQVSDIYKRRADQKLCSNCGARPQFWGQRCVICRQLRVKDPLPRGARAAVRKYRELEAQCSREKSRETVRIAARKLVAGGTLKEREKEALQLYLGLEDNGWRTYKEVAQLMNVSAERVRQLLLPSKAALASSLGKKVRWRTAKQIRKRRVPPDLLLIGDGSSSCEHSKMKIFRRKSFTCTPAGFPNFILQGLPIVRCAKCDVEKCQIPRRAELQDLLARALLCKSDLLSGREIRFLRRVAGIKTAELAERLDVTRQTVQTWETQQALRFANEIAARLVLASLILEANISSQTFKLPDMIRNGDPKPSVIRAEWLGTVGRWRLASH